MGQLAATPLKKKQPPPLPRRRVPDGDGVLDSDGMLVVAAPDSEPSTPVTDHQGYMAPWVDDDDDIDLPSSKAEQLSHSPRLPKRSLSRSPEEDGPSSWTAAQERELRSRSLWVDEEAGSH